MNGYVEEIGPDGHGSRRRSSVKKPIEKENNVPDSPTADSAIFDGLISRFYIEYYVEVAKMKAWEVIALLSGFFVLNVKAFILLAMDIYQFFFPPEEKSLQGQLVLITGAGQNLGRELALQLARLGAKMILLDINEKQNMTTAEMIRENGGEAHSFTCDVSDQKSVAAIGTRVRREIGHPGYVFSNAGTYEHKPFLSHTPNEIQRLVNVNLLGNLWVTREFLGHMMQHNRGHIVSISSVLGFIGRNNVVPYCASKFGVKGMTEALGEEMRMERRSGVKITAVHPFIISNIDDVTPNLKFPWLFEILEPSDAASRIISGVRRNEEEIFLPEKLKPFMQFSRVLPRKLRRLFADYMES